MELDREDLRLWLVAKEPDEPVGTPTHCPISAYLHELTGEMWIVTGELCFSVPGPAQKGPPWLSLFVRPIDDLALRDEDLTLDWSGVTAKQALGILDSIEVSS